MEMPAGNGQEPRRLLEQLSAPRYHGCGSTAMNSAASADILERLAHDHFPFVRAAVGRNTDTPAEVLVTLAH